MDYDNYIKKNNECFSSEKQITTPSITGIVWRSLNETINVIAKKYLNYNKTFSIGLHDCGEEITSIFLIEVKYLKDHYKDILTYLNPFQKTIIEQIIFLFDNYESNNIVYFL